MPFPVVVHEDAAEIGMAVEGDPEHVPRLTFEPVRRRPDADDARHGLAVADPDLQPYTRRSLAQRKQVVADREPLRLLDRQALIALRRRLIQIPARRCPDVARDAGLAPAQVVGRGEVGEKVEAKLVTQMQRGINDARRVDDERRLAVLAEQLDQTGSPFQAQEATPLIS